MSSLKVTLCAGAAALTAVIVPASYATAADGGGSVTLTPSNPVAGGEVALRVSGCVGSTAVAVSEAFVSDARLVGAGGMLAGETKVRSSIGAGTYDVKITCVDFQVKGRIKVVAGALPADPSAPRVPTAPATATATVTAPATAPVTPIAPVRAGGGGSAPLAAAEAGRTTDGPGTAQAVTGLVLAGVAAAVVAFRGVRRSRRAG
ncbi:hypothetical protein ACWD4Z_01700 [Streptomyces antibioticus]|uniref:hypothetical protein n=1 Tax=Streptomyces sp. Amel2xC10 TaxID=1305826 RepID=UPI000A08C63D|nr:hypothetical protein [Streptomyces sp. Amel2xC10]SMF07260.1 hypothetical protein SAMN02745830_01463 [Streptomyces sp. Amel2xC10]